jgi:hypothetical protein
MLKGSLLFLYEELLRFCLLRAMPSPTSRQQTWAAVLETLTNPISRRRLKQNVQMIFDPPPSNSIAARPTLLEELAAEGQSRNIHSSVFESCFWLPRASARASAHFFSVADYFFSLACVDSGNGVAMQIKPHG